MSSIIDKEYLNWLNEIKSQIKSTQIKAALSASSEIIQLYWNIGKSIIKKQEVQKWGSSVVDQLSRDLKREFPDVSGLSRTNLFAMRQFYLFYKDNSEFVPQLVGQIPWGSYSFNN